MNNQTIIAYITGKPGIGKYTIAKTLAKQNNFIICDNHLINNPIFELLSYDGCVKIPEFAWDAIGNIRRCVLDFLAKKQDRNYILTNNLYDDSGDKLWYGEVVYMAESRGSIFVPIRLSIEKNEHMRRITNPARSERWKSIDPKNVDDETPLLPISHQNLLELDVTNLTPEGAAVEIMDHIHKIMR